MLLSTQIIILTKMSTWVLFYASALYIFILLQLPPRRWNIWGLDHSITLDIVNFTILCVLIISNLLSKLIVLSWFTPKSSQNAAKIILCSFVSLIVSLLPTFDFPNFLTWFLMNAVSIFYTSGIKMSTSYALSAKTSSIP